MSRHNLTIPTTNQLKKHIKDIFKLKETDIPETLNFAWGLDHDGYFIQIWLEDEEDLFIEDGLMGTNKSRIIEKLEKYGLLNFIKESSPTYFDCLILDLPF